MAIASDKLAGLEGLIPPDEGEELAKLAAEVPKELAIVEIGAYMGMSTCYLAAGAKEGFGARVWSIDPWDMIGNPMGKHGYSRPIVRRRWEEQVREMKLISRVTPIQSFSNDAAAEWSGPQVGLLFVDGDHEEEAIRTDLEAWSPHLAAKHVILLDDYATKRNPGVKVVAEALADEGYSLEIRAERLAVLRPPLV